MTEEKAPTVGAEGAGGGMNDQIDFQLDYIKSQCVRQNKLIDYPIAYGRVIAPGDTYKFLGEQRVSVHWQIIVRCPYCGREHSHSWEPGAPRAIDTRESHCDGYPWRKRRYFDRHPDERVKDHTYRLVVKADKRS